VIVVPRGIAVPLEDLFGPVRRVRRVMASTADAP